MPLKWRGVRCWITRLLRYRDPVVDRGNVTSTTVIRVVFTTSYFQTVKIQLSKSTVRVLVRSSEEN